MEAVGVTGAVGVAGAVGAVRIPEALPADLRRPGALARLAATLENAHATEITVLPWRIGEGGKVGPLVAAAQKFTRDIAEGRKAPGK